MGFDGTMREELQERRGTRGKNDAREQLFSASESPCQAHLRPLPPQRSSAVAAAQQWTGVAERKLTLTLCSFLFLRAFQPQPCLACNL